MHGGGRLAASWCVCCTAWALGIAVGTLAAIGENALRTTAAIRRSLTINCFMGSLLSLPLRADTILDFQDLLSRLFTSVNFFLCIVYLP